MAKEWTNKDIERDPEGYLEWQRKERERKAAEQEKRRADDDLKRFTEAFVAAGGSKSDATAAWKAHRNEQASETAKRADREAELQARRQIMARL